MKAMKIEMWAIDKVLPYDRNVKKHNDDQVAMIVDSITKFGWDQPIVVDKNGVIIKGHGRRLAAINIGLKEVPVLVRSDLTEEQTRIARLADNKTALSGIDTEMLKQEIENLNREMLSPFYSEKEFKHLLDYDLGDMNLEPIIPDVGAAVLEQEGEARDKADGMAKRDVPLSKAFGFTSIKGSDEIYLTRFMARVEAETGLTGSAALIHFVKTLVG